MSNIVCMKLVGISFQGNHNICIRALFVLSIRDSKKKQGRLVYGTFLAQ
jgi:hypothetical protein